jgi:hypothetical protein
MSLIAVTIPVVSGFESDMQAFYDAHPLLTLDDVKVHSVNDNGIYLTYDNTKEQE